MKTEEILFIQNDPLTAKIIESNVSGEQKIHIESILIGQLKDPNKHIERSILLDSNVCSFIRQKNNGQIPENIKQLITYAKDGKKLLDPSFWLAEQRLSHGNPDEALDYFVQSLKQHYQYVISAEEIKSIKSHMGQQDTINMLKQNIGLVEAYLPEIKTIFNRSEKVDNSLSNQEKAKIRFTKKIKALKDSMKKGAYPISTFVFFFASVAFFVKAYEEKFPKEERNKVCKDMDTKANTKNLAFDIAIFYFSTQTIRRKNEPDRLFVSEIASADVSFPVFVRNIKCLGIQYKESDENHEAGAFANEFFTIVKDGDFDDESYKIVMAELKDLKTIGATLM